MRPLPRSFALTAGLAAKSAEQIADQHMYVRTRMNAGTAQGLINMCKAVAIAINGNTSVGKAAEVIHDRPIERGALRGAGPTRFETPLANVRRSSLKARRGSSYSFLLPSRQPLVPPALSSSYSSLRSISP